MLGLKFDREIQGRFKDIAIIDYGIVEGNNIIVFIKAGQNGSLSGYQNKYIKMARRINEKYGCSVICSSNPFDGNNPLDNAMEIIEDYAKKFEVKRHKCLIESSNDKSLYEKFCSCSKSYSKLAFIVSKDEYITVSPSKTHSFFVKL